MRDPADALTTEQELLLKGALLRGAEGLDAWQVWSARTSVDALDQDSQWLLPWLYQNLRDQGVPHDRTVRYRNVYLHNWYKNNLMWKQAATVLPRLEHAYGRVVLLGGTAMALRHAEAFGTRPFSSVTVLVRGPVGSDDAALPDGGGLVEVRRCLHGDALDDALARRAVASSWKTTRWLALEPADQLLDICLRRRTWDARSRLLWMADAVWLIRQHPALDWARIIAVSGDIGRRESVVQVLDALDRRFSLGIPLEACRPGGVAVAASA